MKSLFEMVKRSIEYTAERTTNQNYGRLKKVKSGNRNMQSRKTSIALIKKVIHGTAEKKEVLTSVNATLTAASQAAIILVNAVAEGTDYNQRVGRSVTHSYIEVDLVLYAQHVTAASNGFGDAGFWALVLDRQPGGANPSFSNIFDDSLGLGAVGTDFRITSSNQDRFKILCREEFSVGMSTVQYGSTESATGAAPYHIKKYVDLSRAKDRDDKAMFVNANGNIGAFDYGSIYFVVASSLATADMNTIIIGQTKYRFTDL